MTAREIARLKVVGYAERQREREKQRAARRAAMDAAVAQREGYLLRPPAGGVLICRRKDYRQAMHIADRVGGVVVEARGAWEGWTRP